MTETSFIARKTPKGYSLRADGVYFGSLYLDRDGKVVGGSFRDDEVRSAFRRLTMNGATRSGSLADYLAACRKAYEFAQDDWAAEAAAERASERAMWNHLESDPQAFDEMVREDMMGLS